MLEVGVAGGNRQCRISPEYDLCSLFSMLRQSRAPFLTDPLTWQTDGQTDRIAMAKTRWKQ